MRRADGALRHLITWGAIQRDALKVPGVTALHDLHVWALAPRFVALSAHVEMASMERCGQVITDLAEMLVRQHGISHVTLQPETPVIVNPGAFTHYSYALSDAARMVTTAGIPLVEVHISNPHAREEFRHTSVISSVASGVVAGFGFGSYALALSAILHPTG